MKIYFESYGCTLNSGEQKKMTEAAEKRGHRVISGAAGSDTVVILTCTVIEQTELKMYKRIAELKALGKRLVVAGCMAAVQGESISEKVPDAVLIPTPGQVDGFIRFLDELQAAGDHEHIGTGPGRYLHDVSTPVPIAEGCMGTCKYCITRLARGRLRSYDRDEIIADIENSVRNGAREVRLTAQDSATYGIDKKGALRLPGLLNDITGMEILKDKNVKIRLGMMNPNSLMPIIEDVIESYRSPRMFSFLHLPVQSGSDRILEQMGRYYKVEQFEQIVERFREGLPELTLSTDIIVGYPGETREDHEASKELLMRIRPGIVNITRYSERPGTPALDLPGKVHGRITKERSRELTKLCRDISMEANREYIGQTVTMMSTERNIGKHKNSTMGRLDNYKPVVVDGNLELGVSYKVKITKVTEAYLIGSRVDHA